MNIAAVNSKIEKDNKKSILGPINNQKTFFYWSNEW